MSEWFFRGDYNFTWQIYPKVEIHCWHDFSKRKTLQEFYNSEDPNKITELEVRIDNLGLLPTVLLYDQFRGASITDKDIFMSVFLETSCLRFALYFYGELFKYKERWQELSEDDVYYDELKKVTEIYFKISEAIQQYNIKISDSMRNRKSDLIDVFGKFIELYEYLYNYQGNLQDDVEFLFKFLHDMDESFFQSHKLILTPSNIISEYQITTLLQYLDKITEKIQIQDMFYYKFGDFSSGEDQLLDSYSMLHSVINNKKTNMLILLDEPDARLHPEWSRKYLSYLLKFLDAEGERLGIKFQVVLTTHSPYLISDLPKENIILLEKDEKTGKRTARKSNYGFASNYYDIMSDNFFLDDTIGEFAKQKINGCIQAINHISDDLDKLANDELILHDGLSLFVEDSLKIIEEQNQIIDLVGDKFIQKQLQQLSDSVKQRLLAHSDDAVRKQKIEQDIAELEEKLRQKKMELKND